MAIVTQVVTLSIDAVIATIAYDDTSRIVQSAEATVAAGKWARIIVWKGNGNLWFDQTFTPSPTPQVVQRNLTNPQKFNIDADGVRFIVCGG